MAGGGIVWAVYLATNGLVLGNNPVVRAFGSVLAQRGPLEISAVGMLFWLMGKWRMHTSVNR